MEKTRPSPTRYPEHNPDGAQPEGAEGSEPLDQLPGSLYDPGTLPPKDLDPSASLDQFSPYGSEGLSPTPDNISAGREAADNLNRTQGAEKLRRSDIIRSNIDSITTEVVSGISKSIALNKNRLSIPKTIILGMRFNSAKRKHNRKVTKANNAKAAAEQARSEVGNGHIFNGKHKANRLERKSNKLQGKADSYKQNTLDGRESRVNDHSSMLKNRLNHADKVRNTHENIHTKKIEMYRDRKSLAESRKEMRHMSKELRRSGASKAEANRTMSEISLENRLKIGAAGCRIEAAAREHRNNQKATRRLEKEAAGVSKKLIETRESLDDENEIYTDTAQRLEETNNLKADMVAEQSSLINERDKLDPDDPEYTTKLVGVDRQLEKLAKAIAYSEKQSEILSSKLSDLTESIAYLEGQVAEQKSKKAAANNDVLAAELVTLKSGRGLNDLETDQRQIINDSRRPQAQAQPSPQPIPARPTTPAEVPANPVSAEEQPTLF
ncbi:MAG: hypothetical protein ABI397_02820 [Candidatus Saccharimonas sp.]